MAERNDIADAIEGLAVHCRPPLMTVEDKTRWVADWCEDLREYPIDAIRLACNRWRNGNNRKFPMPGQLRPMIQAVLVRTNDPGKPNQNEQWRPLTDDEYRSLSLNGKIRHHQILAAQARQKAGPMWMNGRHMMPEDMPQEWRELRQRAANHEAEVKRLREFASRELASA